MDAYLLNVSLSLVATIAFLALACPTIRKELIIYKYIQN